jgi:hypothetical protein
LYDTPEQRWWSGFYTAASDFNVESALRDTGNANYTLLIKDIDDIAVQLGLLRDAGVPVIWRPLHEAEGGWFWWGAKGPEVCKKCKFSSFLDYRGFFVGHGTDEICVVSMAYPLRPIDEPPQTQ